VTEQAGKACRDDSVEGLRFYPNLFAERATWSTKKTCSVHPRL
jgi:hypothetical protein